MQLANVVSALAITALAGLASAQNANNTVVANVQALNHTVDGKDYTLATALKLAGSVQPVVDALNNSKNITLFAPTDDAFKAFGAANPVQLVTVTSDPALTQKVLLYHTVGSKFLPAGQPAKQFIKTGDGNNWIQVDVNSGKVMLFFNGGNATVIDSIPSSNGIVHVIDNVLQPPPSAVDDLKKEGLDTLITQVQAANLTSAVSDLNNATLFAPTNNAFDTVLGFAKSNNLTLNATMLAGILRFHVVPGTYFSTDIAAIKTAKLATLLAGQSVNVTYDGSDVKLYGAGQTALKLAPATVTKADILVAGGVMHIIDAVLIPDLNAAVVSGNDTTGANPNSTTNANGTTTTNNGTATGTGSASKSSAAVLASSALSVFGAVAAAVLLI
ncbi:hypothetical protein HDU87_002122 [Geranomyces variabilis]|uniref:FAS1 domain-containing protein n=1 Tax=Geranomyces variabilis TaxID=109894 RepID=A0AAD5TLR8_9FUNG|nr:hypothetical protein HDU87_002122 [Geranomyces variabilis]